MQLREGETETMRPLALMATVLTIATASAAGQQTLGNGGAAYEAFTGQPPPIASSDVDPISRLLDRDTYAPGQGLVRWTTNQVQLSPSNSGGPVDLLRFSLGGVVRDLGGSPYNFTHGPYDTEAYELALSRNWPAALAFNTRSFGVDLTPHAGLGITNLGGSAEAGATLRLSQRDDELTARLHALGVRDGSSFGQRGRWYLFAAASGRAVGLNMLHNDTGWDRAGWTTDATSTLIGDTQIGVGWRKGAVQTSLGYIHREVRGQNELWGIDAKPDSMVAFSFSIRPHQ